MPRVLTALCAVAVSLFAFCVGDRAAFAVAPAVVYVDQNAGSDSNDCATTGTACQTITQALQVVADAGTVEVGPGTYVENLAPQRPVTLAGSGSVTLDGTLDVHAAGVEITGLTFAGAATPQLHIDDPNPSDIVSVHGNTFTATGNPAPTAVAVDGNAATTAITDNSITGTADGIDVTAGGSDSPYTITGNRFSLAGGTGTAIALSAAGAAQLSAAVGGNSGTIAATGHTITRTTNVTVTPTDVPNSITSAATALTPDHPTLSVITEQAATPFQTVTTSDLDLTGARFDVAVATTGGINPADVALRYSTDDVSFTRLDLTGGGASLAAGAGIPGTAPATVYYQLSVGAAAPAGTVTVTLSVDESTSTRPINTVARTAVAVTVSPNRAPSAMPQSVSVQRNGTVPITLTGIDPDLGDTVTGFVLATTATQGTVVQSPTDPSQVSYTAPADFSGKDTFAFFATDDHGNESASAAAVTVTVGPDTAPSAADISIPATTLMAPAGSSTIDLSAGPSDPDGDSFTYSVQPFGDLTAGTVSVTGHSASYTPDAGTTGRHAFEYRVWDGTAYSNWAVATFTVDSSPVAVGQSGLTVSHASLAPLAIPALSATDADLANGDVLTYALPTPGSTDYPAHGTLGGTAPDAVTYAPNPGYTGPDQFRFTVTDNSGAASSALVNLTVTDLAPTTTGFTTTIPDAVATRTIQLTGSDPDGDALVYALAPSAPAFLTVDPNTGLVTVTQTTAHAMPFAFGYTVTDALAGARQSARGTVTVVVNSVPTGTPQTLGTAFNTRLVGTVSATDADPPIPSGTITSYRRISRPTHAAYFHLDQPSGAFTYTPTRGYAGPDSFTFTASDGYDWSAPATINITVAKATTTIALAILPAAPTSADRPVATVRLTSAGNTSTGVVTIRTGGFGTPKATIASGLATIPLPRFPGGPQSITAVFGGTGTAAPASKTLAFTVTKVASEIAFKTNPLQLTTGTSTAKATVTITAGPFRPSAGTVTIDENGTRLAQGTPTAGVVTLRLPRFSLGQHNLTVGYTGTTFIAASSVVEVERVGLG